MEWKKKLLGWTKHSYVIWPFVVFVGRSLYALARFLYGLFRRLEEQKKPIPPLVVRVGVAGHRDLANCSVFLETAIDEILIRLKETTLSYKDQFTGQLDIEVSTVRVDLRLISQLAAGADQLMARRALASGFSLHVPVPVGIDLFRRDVELNRGSDTNPGQGLEDLAGQAASLLQLDGDLQGEKLAEDCYVHSALTMLEHSDILIVLLRNNPPTSRGGSAWLKQQALQRNAPVVTIPIENPYQSQLDWGSRTTKLFEKACLHELIRSIVLPPVGAAPLPDPNWFSRSYRDTFRRSDENYPLNAEEAAPKSTRETGFAAKIDDLYKEAWMWAEHRAGAYQSIYRGAYLTIAVLSLLAVCGAVAGAMNPDWSAGGKWLEVIVIFLLLTLWKFARDGKWRQRWLSYRVCEEQLRHATVLAAVGRTTPNQNDPTHEAFQDDNAWMEWYARCLIRQAVLPTERLDAETVAWAKRLVLDGQIKGQIRYYESKGDAHHAAGHRLESFALAALLTTLSSAIMYLGYKHFHLHVQKDLVQKAAKFFGLFSPSVAATLAAIRAQGEHAQLSRRYAGMRKHLERLKTELEEDPDAAKSWKLADYSKRATGALLAEVNQWRSLLATNEIERG